MRMRQSSALAHFAGLTAVLLVFQPCLGATWHPHPKCEGACGEQDHLCRSSSDCKTEWDSCPAGTAQVGNATRVKDTRGECHWTDCSPGGCEEDFEQEGPGETCVSLTHCREHVGICRKEYCCPLRPSVTCCPLLPCSAEYQDCQMPRQAYLADASRSAVEWKVVRHGESEVFPFYSAATIPPGGSCDSVRLHGRCLCDDGRRVPGCEPTNSSTWFLRAVDGPQPNTTAAEAATDTALLPLLPANLSLTCYVTPAAESPAAPAADGVARGLGSPSPPPLPPPPPSPPSGGGGSEQPRSQGRSQPHGNGALVAAIVIGCLVLAGCTSGIVLWCCGLLPDLHNLRIRNLTSYEPIFTGQSYSPSRNGGGHHRHPQPPSGGGAAAFAEDIPWTRFCAAVQEAGRRILYGRRYVEESASAAAAAERYRALNALGRRRSELAVVVGVNGDDGDAAERAWPAGKAPTRGSLLLATYPSGRHKAHDDDDDDLGVNEVFTLEDLGAVSSATAVGTAPWRPVGQLRVSRSTAAGGGGNVSLPPLPQSVHTSSSASTTTVVASPSGPWRHSGGGAAAAATADGGGPPVSRGPSALGVAAAGSSTGQVRPRLNQFGGSSLQGPEASEGTFGAGSAAGDASGGGPHVIHTRPLKLHDSDGDELEVPPDVDAPLHWLPSPQVTGQGPGGPS